MADEAKLTCLKNGPYLLFGCSVTKPDGMVIEATEGKPLVLCACGASKSKPACDGSHKETAHGKE